MHRSSILTCFLACGGCVTAPAPATASPTLSTSAGVEGPVTAPVGVADRDDFARPVAAEEPARPLTVLYGTGLAHSSVGAVCDLAGKHCAVADLDGRIAIIDRAGGVLATGFFRASRDAIAFDAQGARLGVGAADWDWRTGEVHQYAASVRPPCVAFSANRVAWLEGRQFGPPARIHVQSRVSAQQTFSVELTSADIKYLLFAGDELLLVVHTDALEAFDLAAAAPKRWSLQLPPETGDRMRPYGGEPRVQLTRAHVLLKVTRAEVRVLTRKLELVRTLELHGEELTSDPGSDRFARARELEGGHVQIDVEEVGSAKVIASTVIDATSQVEVRFWGDRLILRHGRAALVWDLVSAPTVLADHRDPPRPLVVVGNDQLEARSDAIRFRALDGAHPPREVSSFAAQFLPTRLALRDGHAIVRSGWQLEAWGPRGEQEVDQEDARLVLGARAELNRLRSDEKGDFLSGPKGEVTRVHVGEGDWVHALAMDSEGTRAVVVLKSEWRLYDTKAGKVLRSSPRSGWHRPVVSLQPGGRSFLFVDEEHLATFSRDGKPLARLPYPRVKPLGSRGGSGDQPTAQVVWTSVGVAVSLWSDPDVWFMKAPSLEILGRAPGAYGSEGLARLTSGVAVLDQRGALLLYTEAGALRKKVEVAALATVSADGALLAYCEKDAVTVLDELGKEVDADASLCDGASALAVSRSHLAVVHRAEVRLLRRDDRSRWVVRSFVPGSRGGFGRVGEREPPPRQLLVVQQDGRFELSDLAAGAFVTVFGGSPTATPGLFAELWR